MLIIRNHIQLIIYVICALLAFIPISTSATEKTDPNTVYYTELTCKPEKDIFEMHPKSISKTELAGKKDAQSEVLKTKDYAVFLNGKLVGEKVFKQDCLLKNEVKVEVDVDYGRDTKKPILRKDNPEIYQFYYKHGKIGGGNMNIFNAEGELKILWKTKVIGVIGNRLLNENYRTQISYQAENLSLKYGVHKQNAPVEEKFLLENMKKFPVLNKVTVIWME